MPSVRTFLLATFLAATLVGGTALPVAAHQAPGMIAIEQVTVLPMDGTGGLTNRTVLVRGDRIAAIGESGTMFLPADARRLDGRGKYLMPGLVDAHVHLIDTRDLTLYLAHGVTTILNMSGNPMHLALRERIRRGEVAGPTLYTTGPQFKLEANPAVDMELAVHDPEEAAARVRQVADAGFDFVKIWGAFSPEVYTSIVAAARARHIPVTGHIPLDVGLEGVIAAGQGSIAHLEEYFNKVFQRQVNDAGIPDVALRTANAGIPVITTLVTYEAIAGAVAADPAPLLARPARALLDPVRAMLWEPPFNRYRRPQDIGRDGFYRDALAFEQRIAVALHRSGVPLLLGTDAGELPGLVPGADVHRELELLVEAGLTPIEALGTATRSAGLFLGGSTERFGTVTAGSRADLLLLDADPRVDIRNARRVAGVMTRGIYHPRTELDRMMAAVAEENARTGRFVAAALVSADSATAYYRAARTRDPAQPVFAEGPVLLLAFGLGQQGKVAEAATLLQVVVQAYPESYLPRYILGAALLGAGRIAEGKALIEQVVRLVPDHGGAKELLSRTP